MKLKYISAVFLTAVTLSGCEKEIEMAFHEVEPVVVIEGSVSNAGTEVRVGKTRNVDSTEPSSPVRDAEITIVYGGEEQSDFVCGEDGVYRPTQAISVIVGEEYSLRVRVDGRDYRSEATMQGEVSIDDVAFQWEQSMDTRMLYCRVFFEDRVGESNFYSYRMYRNGELYAWGVSHDRGREDETIKLNISCMSEKKAEKDEPEDRKQILYEGDRITVELETIDERAYDYLYSLKLSDGMSSSPIDNFTGGCLGYFRAGYVTSYETVFSYESVRDGDEEE